MDKLASDVTLEGSMLDGAVHGADAIRAVIGAVRELYAHQQQATVIPLHRRPSEDSSLQRSTRSWERFGR